MGLRDEGSTGGVEHIYDTVYDTTTNLGDLEGLSDEGSTRGVEHFRLRVARGRRKVNQQQWILYAPVIALML